MEDLFRKQTGTFQPVKIVCGRDLRLVTTALFVIALGSCAGADWQQAGKSAAQTKADLIACERDAETRTLAARGQTRSTYASDRNDLGVRGPRTNPMDLKDRSEAAEDYGKALRRCMIAAGYADGSN